jgi:prolipoprotein diacylglyceryltransferase
LDPVRYTAAVPLAVITLEFDPVFRLGDWAVRWETLAIGGAILVGLVLAGLLAGRSYLPSRDDDTPGGNLRRDDVLFIALGIVPGAILGGRLAYVALHLDYYSGHSAAIVDPASGGLALSGAVVLGALSGGLVARLFDAPIGRWYEIGALPMLVVISLGKAANVLGGTGQGLPSGLDWATSYLGPGPWGSLGPGIPSFPAQAAEALAVALLLVVVAGTWAVGGLRAHDGRGFALALGGWAAIRFAIAGTWRDPIVVGPFRAEQVIDLAIVGLALVILVGLLVRARRARPVWQPQAQAGSRDRAEVGIVARPGVREPAQPDALARTQPLPQRPARVVAGGPARFEAIGAVRPEARPQARPEGRPPAKPGATGPAKPGVRRPPKPGATGPAKPESRGPARPKARRPPIVDARPDAGGLPDVDDEPDGVSSVTDTPPPRGLR